MVKVHWTHAEDLRNIYGVEPDGYARNTYDNVGVQYGLKALTDGNITPAEFLERERHASAAGRKRATWSRRPSRSRRHHRRCRRRDRDSTRGAPGNMRLSSDGGATPAPRRAGDLDRDAHAYNRGLYFDGKIDIPLIDWRHYLEEELDMHNSHQSFASRQRMLDRDGNASNQVIWFTDARPARAVRPDARGVRGDRRVDGEHPREPEAGRGGQQAGAGDGPLLHDRRHGDRPRRGRLGRHPRQRGPTGACTQAFPLHSTSRIVAGGPLRGGVYKCALQSVDARDREGAVRVLDAVGGRGRAAEADLPDRGLRLHASRTSAGPDRVVLSQDSRSLPHLARGAPAPESDQPTRAAARACRPPRRGAAACRGSRSPSRSGSGPSAMSSASTLMILPSGVEQHRAGLAVHVDPARRRAEARTGPPPGEQRARDAVAADAPGARARAPCRRRRRAARRPGRAAPRAPPARPPARPRRSGPRAPRAARARPRSATGARPRAGAPAPPAGARCPRSCRRSRRSGRRDSRTPRAAGTRRAARARGSRAAPGTRATASPPPPPGAPGPPRRAHHAAAPAATRPRTSRGAPAPSAAGRSPAA